MDKDQILKRLQPVFTEVFFDPVEVSPDLNANDVDEWDSLIQISLVVGIEKEFSVKFGLGEVEATNNVGELADLIQRHLEK